MWEPIRMSKDLKLFGKYVMPSIIAMVIGGSFSIVDTIFIGQADGKNGLAAVSLTWPLLMLLMGFGSLIGGGGAVLISQCGGAGDQKRKQEIFDTTIFMIIVSSLVLFVSVFPFLEDILRFAGANAELMGVSLRYSQIILAGLVVSIAMNAFLEIVRNDGHPTLAMAMMVTGLLGNLVLDWLFVFYFNYGAVGAGIATIVSEAIIALMGVIYFCSPWTELRFTLKIFRPLLQEIKNITVTGLPIFGNMISIIAMLYMHNEQSLRYGGVDALAAYTVIAALESLGSMLLTGIAGGIQPLTASMYGAGKHKRQNRFGNMGYVTAFIVGIMLTVFSFCMYKVMPEWMGLDSGRARDLAMTGILISAPAFLLLGLIRVAAFYYQSTGNIAKSSWLIYGDSFLALPLCIFVLPLFWGINGVWMAMPVSRILLMLMLLYFWFGTKKKRKTV